MNKTTKILSLAVAMFAMVGLVTFPMAEAYYPPPKYEGCTPGFYKANEKKNEGDQWPAKSFEGVGIIASTTSLSDVGINTIHVDSNTKLIDALKFKGGPEDIDAEQIYLRAAVAAFLNANNPDVNYPIPAIAILEVINDTLANAEASGEFRDRILHAAAILDEMNNIGCPLSNSGRP